MEIMTQETARARVKMLEEMCAVRPASSTMADLAATYFTLEQTERALPLAQMAWDISRQSGNAMLLALILKDLGRHDESARVVQEAYWLNSDDNYIQMGYGEALLKAGFWKQGWPVYDNARQTQRGAAGDLRLPTSVKEWEGEPLTAAQTLLVINEGGTGDRISYARWLPELTKRGINWRFYPYDALFSFFERIFPPERLVKDNTDMVPDPTHWTTTFALPAKLGVIPNEVPPPLTFTPLPEMVAKYKFNRVDTLPVVGICYEAAEMFQGGRRVRSLSEGQALRLICATVDKIHWVNLQHGKIMPYPVTNVPFETWEDTAGLISNLDAVVSVDTGTMHLTGTLNKPMAVLLSGNSCWKFLRKGKKLPLYPTATFYRNPGRGFEDAITELIFAIRNNTAW